MVVMVIKDSKGKKKDPKHCLLHSSRTRLTVPVFPSVRMLAALYAGTRSRWYEVSMRMSHRLFVSGARSGPVVEKQKGGTFARKLWKKASGVTGLLSRAEILTAENHSPQVICILA